MHFKVQPFQAWVDCVIVVLNPGLDPGLRHGGQVTNRLTTPWLFCDMTLKIRLPKDPSGLLSQPYVYLYLIYR